MGHLLSDPCIQFTRILHQLPNLAESVHLEERGVAEPAAEPHHGRVRPRQPRHHQPHLC